jgi:short-subunit dehydrogenase
MASYLGLVLLMASAVGCATSGLNKRGQKAISRKTFVIVGASSGFGRGVAEQLGRYGAQVVIAARRTELLENVAKNITAAGGKAVVVTMDISRPEDVQRLADEAVKHFGKVDVWINNAGVGIIGKFWEIPQADMARLIDINLKGFVYGTQAALKLFMTQGYGTIINLGSVESEVPQAYHSVYSASKAAIRSLGLAIDQELRLNGEKKIKVVTVEPWATDTPWFEHAANYSGGTPQMIAIDGPQKVVNAIVWSSLHHPKELPVGGKAKMAHVNHRLFPRTIERLTANVAHRRQMKLAPPAPNTEGSLYKSTDKGAGIEGGIRARLKQEKSDRKKKRKSQ